MKTFPQPLTAQEEKYYVELLEKGDRAARDILIERNLRLVAHLVKKYSQNEREAEDFISIGTVGLIKAVDTFRSGKGNRLSTYAAKCIEKAILSQKRFWKRIRQPCLYGAAGFFSDLPHLTSLFHRAIFFIEKKRFPWLFLLCWRFWPAAHL